VINTGYAFCLEKICPPFLYKQGEQSGFEGGAMLKIRAEGIVFLMARIDNGFEDCYDYRVKPTFFIGN
jgi:hypothetical protein